MRSTSKDYFRTWTGVKIKAKAPVAADIRISDIARGLSLTCRFSGQLPSLYSVAAHSIVVSEWIERNGGSPKEALAGLLHDASEAYCADVPSPMKALCKDYQRLEKRFQKAIAKRFNLKYPFTKIVHQADKEVLFDERLFQKGWKKIPMASKNVEKLFLLRFKELGGV